MGERFAADFSNVRVPCRLFQIDRAIPIVARTPIDEPPADDPVELPFKLDIR